MRIDTRDKLDGSLIYGVDYTLPGMLVAVPKACSPPADGEASQGTWRCSKPPPRA